jgi:glycosyltransferase involved in cell wall biosynthesis
VSVNFVVVSRALGGAELYVLRLAEAVRDTDVQVVVLGSPATPALEQARARGLATGELRLGRKLGATTALPNLLRYPLARRRLQAAVREQSTAGGWTVLQFKWEQILWGGEVAPGRVCMLEHGPIPGRLLRSQWARRRLRTALREAAVVAAASVPASDAIRSLAGREACWLPAGGPSQVNGAVRLRAAELRERYAPTGKLLAYAGRITREKGVFDVVELVREQPDLAVAIAGEGPDLEALRRSVRAGGLDGRVHVPGFVADPTSLLAAADATMLVSTEAGEGRPLAAIESLALGTPVVGLRTSPALRALAAEFPGSVHLSESGGPRDLRAAVDAAVAGEARAQPVGDWSRTAAILLEAMEAAHEAHGRQHVRR